jgi:mannose-1-phosphate guanylyltransferase / phosphomannomutase
VVTARDGHPASRMLKRALVSGLCSVGVNCIDTQALPLPLARTAIKFNSAKGGVNVRVDPDDPENTIVEFYNGEGFYITKATERKLESIYFREDYARADSEHVGRIDPAPTTIDEYRQLLLSRIASRALIERKFKIVLDCAFGTTGSVLPELLGRLGCEVIALNAYTDWAREPRTPESRAQHLTSLAQVVRTLGADVGALIHSDGERVELVDAGGTPIYGAKLLAVLTSLTAQRHPGARFAVPVSAPSAIETIAEGRVARTQTDPRFLMTMAYLPGEKVVMAGDLSGGFIFPGHSEESGGFFHPTFDGMFALVKTLKMLAFLQTSLAEVAASLPPIYLASRDVECPSNDKGMVMKALTQELSAGDRRVELIDGIKTFEAPDAWTLIVPDSGPRFFVQSEGPTESAAAQHADYWASRIDAMVG